MNEAIYRNNLAVLLFQVDFEGSSTNTLRVTYPIRATTDRRDTPFEKNTFTYLLHPARYFSGFGGLEVNVHLNKKCPYIVDSSLPLEEQARGVYSATFTGLPDKDLVFSTYPRSEVKYYRSGLQRFAAGIGMNPGTYVLLIGALSLALYITWLVRKETR